MQDWCNYLARDPRPLRTRLNAWFVHFSLLCHLAGFRGASPHIASRIRNSKMVKLISTKILYLMFFRTASACGQTTPLIWTCHALAAFTKHWSISVPTRPPMPYFPEGELSCHSAAVWCPGQAAAGEWSGGLAFRLLL